MGTEPQVGPGSFEVGIHVGSGEGPPRVGNPGTLLEIHGVERGASPGPDTRCSAEDADPPLLLIGATTWSRILDIVKRLGGGLLFHSPTLQHEHLDIGPREFPGYRQARRAAADNTKVRLYERVLVHLPEIKEPHVIILS